MLKSLCVKTNNNKAINYLLEKFNTVNLNSLYISTAKFKLYNNFIIHYSGKDLDLFYYTFLWLIFQMEEEKFFRYYPPEELLDEDFCADFLTMVK